MLMRWRRILPSPAAFIEFSCVVDGDSRLQGRLNGWSAIARVPCGADSCDSRDDAGGVDLPDPMVAGFRNVYVSGLVNVDAVSGIEQVQSQSPSKVLDAPPPCGGDKIVFSSDAKRSFPRHFTSVPCTGGTKMKAVERERSGSHVARPRKLKGATPRAVSKKVARPAAEEHQIAELERTFSNRWEW